MKLPLVVRLSHNSQPGTWIFPLQLRKPDFQTVTVPTLAFDSLYSVFSLPLFRHFYLLKNGFTSKPLGCQVLEKPHSQLSSVARPSVGPSATARISGISTNRRAGSLTVFWLKYYLKTKTKQNPDCGPFPYGSRIEYE